MTPIVSQSEHFPLVANLELQVQTILVTLGVRILQTKPTLGVSTVKR